MGQEGILLHGPQFLGGGLEKQIGVLNSFVEPEGFLPNIKIQIVVHGSKDLYILPPLPVGFQMEENKGKVDQQGEFLIVLKI